jgi:hypothetical protein
MTEVWFPLSRLLDLGPRGESSLRAPSLSWGFYSITDARVKQLHEAMDGLLLLLLLAGYELSSEGVTLGINASNQLLRVDLTTQQVSLSAASGIDGSEAFAARFPGATWPAGRKAVLAIPLKPRLGLGSAIAIAASKPNSASGSWSNSTGSLLVIGVSVDNEADNDLLVLRLQQGSAWASALLAQDLSTAYHLEGGHPDRVGLMGMYDPLRWAISGDEARQFAFTSVGNAFFLSVFMDQARTTEQLIGDSAPRALFKGSLQVERIGCRQVLDTLESDGLLDSPASDWIAAWNTEAEAIWNEGAPIGREPFKKRDFRVFSYTELLLDAQQQGVFDFLTALGTTDAGDVLTEGRRILEQVPVDQRTPQQWSTLAAFVPLQAPLDTEVDPAAARASSELVQGFRTLDQTTRFAILDALVETVRELPPTSRISEMTALQANWLQSNGRDFEHHLMMLGDCLCLAFDEPVEDAAAARVVDALSAQLARKTWNTAAQGPQGKLGYAIIRALECVRASAATTRGVAAAATYWASVPGMSRQTAFTEWCTAELFERACDLSLARRQLSGGDPAPGKALERLYWALAADSLPWAHTLSDEHVDAISTAFAENLRDRVAVTTTGTDKSQYYHLLMGLGRYYDVTGDIDWRKHFDLEAAHEAREWLERTEQIQTAFSESRQAALDAVLGPGINPTEVAGDMLKWLGSPEWTALLQASDDAQQLLSREIERLMLFDEKAAEHTQEWIFEQQLLANALLSARELLTEDQLSVAYEELLIALAVTPADAADGARRLASATRSYGTALGWLTRAADLQPESKLAGLVTDLGWSTKEAKLKVLNLKYLGAFATAGLLAIGGVLEPPDDLPALFKVTIGLTSFGVAWVTDHMDYWVSKNGWRWVSEPRPVLPWQTYFPDLGAYPLLRHWVADVFRWAIRVPGRFLSWVTDSLAPWIAATARWVRWEAGVAFRALLGVSSLVLGALAESFALVASVQEMQNAWKRGDMGLVRNHAAHAVASVMIIAGSGLGIVVTIAGAYSIPVVLGISIAVLGPIAAALVAGGIALHFAAFMLAPEWFEEGRLSIDLRSLDVLRDEVRLLAGAAGTLEFRQLLGEFSAGAVLARIASSTSGQPVIHSARLAGEVESWPSTSAGVEVGTFVQPTTALLTYSECFIVSLGWVEGADRITRLVESGMPVTSGQKIGRVELDEGPVDLLSPATGTLFWYEGQPIYMEPEVDSAPWGYAGEVLADPVTG